MLDVRVYGLDGRGEGERGTVIGMRLLSGAMVSQRRCQEPRAVRKGEGKGRQRRR